MTRYVLLHLQAGDHRAEADRDAMVKAMGGLLEHLWRSLTWDQGPTMARHRQITQETGLPIYFCNPTARGSGNEREHQRSTAPVLPEGTDLSVHSPQHLATVAAQLNGRPRQTLNWKTPAEALNKRLSDPIDPTVVR
jgi:transposase, IS30 family